MQRWRPNHPHLTTQNSFYVEISWARDRAELVIDDAKAVREQLKAVTGEGISALEGIVESRKDVVADLTEAHEENERARDDFEEGEVERGPELKRIERDLAL